MTCQRLRPNLPFAAGRLYRCVCLWTRLAHWPRSRRLLVLCPSRLYRPLYALLPRSEALQKLESADPAFATHACMHGHMHMHAHMCTHIRSVASNPLRRRCNSALQSVRLAPPCSSPSFALLFHAEPRRPSRGLLSLHYSALIWARCMCLPPLHTCMCFVACGTQCACAYIPRPNAEPYPLPIRYSRRPGTDAPVLSTCFTELVRALPTDLMHAVPRSAAHSCVVRWRSLSRTA